LLELRPMRLSLEEIFLQLTTEDKQTAAAAPASTDDTTVVEQDANNG
jgi:hypothetical protein